MADPWHEVKNDIGTILGEVQRLHAAARGLSGPAAHPHLQKLESCLTAADLDLEALEETISIVEAQRTRFPIAGSELESRRAFVRSTAASILLSRREVASLRGAAGASSSAASIAPAHEHGLESESEGLLSGAAKPGNAKASAAAAKAQAAQAAKARRQQAVEAANDHTVSHLGQQQQMELEAQDDVLDDLHGAVSRVKSMAGQMNDELASQNRMINTLEEQMDHVSSTMGVLKSKMKQMASSKDRGKYCAIMWLSLLLVILIMLAVET